LLGGLVVASAGALFLHWSLASQCTQPGGRLAIAWLEPQDLAVTIGLPGRVFEQVRQ